MDSVSIARIVSNYVIILNYTAIPKKMYVSIMKVNRKGRSVSFLRINHYVEDIPKSFNGGFRIIHLSEPSEF